VERIELDVRNSKNMRQPPGGGRFARPSDADEDGARAGVNQLAWGAAHRQRSSMTS
jgi:hypothetical protein